MTGREPALVTGGAGFIGSHLVEELLHRGHRVIVVDDFSTGSPVNLQPFADQVNLVSVDLHSDALRQLLTETSVRTIFHLAARVGRSGSVESPRRDLEANALITLELLEVLRAAAPEVALVHVSSALVYGEPTGRPFREDDATVPCSPYAVSKLAAEHYVAVYAQLYGLRTSILRPFSAYGPRQRKQVVYDLMRNIHEIPDELHVQGDGRQARRFTYVGSVVDALLAVADQGRLEGEAYNVCDEEDASIAELVRRICELMGASPNVVYDGVAGPGDAPTLAGDTSRLRSLGWRPRVTLTEGLAETLAWFRSEVAGGGNR